MNRIWYNRLIMNATFVRQIIQKCKWIVMVGWNLFDLSWDQNLQPSAWEFWVVRVSQIVARKTAILNVTTLPIANYWFIIQFMSGINRFWRLNEWIIVSRINVIWTIDVSFNKGAWFLVFVVRSQQILTLLTKIVTRNFPGWNSLMTRDIKSP